MALSSLGMLVASRIRKLENFAVAMNFVIFPMFFLSGALYPTEKLAAWLQPLVRLNPLTYGVDLMRHCLLAEEFRAVSHVEFEPLFDIAYLLVFSVVCLVDRGQALRPRGAPGADVPRRRAAQETGAEAGRRRAASACPRRRAR